MPDPIDEPELRPEPPLPAAVIVTTAGLAEAAIWTIGWLAEPLPVGTVVLVLVSWAGALEGRGSSTIPNVPPAASAAARTAARTIEPRPAPRPPVRLAAAWSGGTGGTGWNGSGSGG